MAYKLKYPLSLRAGQALLEFGEYMNDWALRYTEYVAEHRARITGFATCIIREDVEEAALIVKRNREAVSKEK